ncbi:hypothetical protein CHGG_03958 [Chaetomium globosum CBS 148.51]|uniref:Uncharacterized protein n=1 Tax=Chaetomium globosum (strain ATCC 6205 / CBS 148.51 / DSM 1962 / NBRC 6347 / NRRL 1970) TaxID=306901 RepID=Q2H2N8_CHAGB|nr:uncharacterized protein CHGG_03958 [Chaetomium globosum CBS 148.51]EAQ87339.1 hypothetical protein CHGG_03958 [Chaetomium globosum CBS 148.51]
MAARSVSPGGALLRTSRMFAMADPIPPPPIEGAAGSFFSSTTATVAFPTHQVITTLSSSRKLGDWGLKRPLPLKSTTKSSNPMLRVKAIDTIEQITDYSSATDHGITLRKFQELGIPVTARRPAGGDRPESTTTMNLPQMSAFEEALDATDIDPDKRAELVDMRWKFTGPWLAGMTQGEFNKWLAKEVRPKRPAFRQFLKKKIASERHVAIAKEALDKGQEQPPMVDSSTVTEDELIDYLRKLRHNNQALYDMVGQFLDLAPLMPPDVSQTGLPKEKVRALQFSEVKTPYAERGPPVTHPSAGLSYLPTGARIGVAGLIVNTALGDTRFNQRNNPAAVFDKIDPSVEGGAKVWVQPTRAAVDSVGCVVLSVNDASVEATLVAQELLGNAVCLGAERAEDEMTRRETANDLRRRYRAPDSPTAMSSARDYGLSE